MKNRIKNRVIDIVARAIYIKDEIKHAQMIAESKAKIGPYVPQPCPVQIWA